MRKILIFFTGIIADRRLLWSLSTKDFYRKYAGSYFGILWSFIQPLLTILVYWAVFQFGFRSGDVGDTPFVLWFIAGIVPWLFIAEAITTSSNSFLEYSYLVKKVVFNINILPIVKIMSSFFIHLFFVLLAIIVAISMNVYPTIYILQLLYYMVCTITFVFAIGIIFSSILVFFRDLNQIIGIILLMGMWGTPIAWNINNFEGHIQRVLKLNPVYYLVEGYRDSLFNGIWFWEKPLLGLYFWVVTGTILMLGVWMFQRLKPHFSDVL